MATRPNYYQKFSRTIQNVAGIIIYVLVTTRLDTYKFGKGWGSGEEADPLKHNRNIVELNFIKPLKLKLKGVSGGGDYL